MPTFAQKACGSRRKGGLRRLLPQDLGKKAHDVLRVIDAAMMDAFERETNLPQCVENPVAFRSTANKEGLQIEVRNARERRGHTPALGVALELVSIVEAPASPCEAQSIRREILRKPWPKLFEPDTRVDLRLGDLRELKAEGRQHRVNARANEDRVLAKSPKRR